MTRRKIEYILKQINIDPKSSEGKKLTQRYIDREKSAYWTKMTEEERVAHILRQLRVRPHSDLGKKIRSKFPRHNKRKYSSFYRKNPIKNNSQDKFEQYLSIGILSCLTILVSILLLRKK